MTKSPHKLMLRKESLRALNSIDLARVVGGDGAGSQVVDQTSPKICLQQQAIILPAK